MHVSGKGLALIKAHEGLRLRAYLCPAGVPTIGWGHTGPDVTAEHVRTGHTITADDAEVLLRQDVGVAERAVSLLVDVPLTQWQFDALVSFVFNVGVGAFRDSTLRRLLNRGQYDAVSAQLARWKYANGKVLPGLVKRRADEAALWAGPPAENATPDNVDSLGARVRQMLGAG